MRKRGLYIKALTDHMFEYAFAYETNEEAVLKRMEIGQVKEILLGNCEFVELAGFTIEGQMEDIEGLMYADEMMLKRMSSNLFSNILKYADKGKPIYVRLRVGTGHARYSFDQYDQAGCRHGGKQSYWTAQQSEDGRTSQGTDACLP